MTQRPSFRMMVGMVVGLVLGTLPMILPAIGLDSPPKSSTGTITTVAGNGVAADTGDGGPAAAASLAYPRSVATGRDGSIYIMVPGSVRKISSTGIISTIAGSHNSCSDSGHAGPAYGDGGPATAALFNCGVAVTVDGVGNLYVADNGNNRIRKIDTVGIITTVVGTGDPGYSGDGGPASAATLNDPSDVEFDSAGNMLIADFGNHRVRRVDGAGIISTVAGNGANGSSGDGGLATEAAFRSIQALAADNLGNIFVSDFGNDNVRRVDAAGVISTVASNVSVLGMEADANGNLFMANGYSDVLRLDRMGTITTVAGIHSTSGFSGDGGPAIKALLVSPQDVAIDAAGNLLIADEQNHRLRKIENGASSGTTTTSTSSTTTSSTSTTSTTKPPPPPGLDTGMRGGTLPANLPPPGLDTGMTVSKGDSVTITAVGSAGYGYEGEPCVGYPRTDPDGNRTISGASCGSPKFDPSATVPNEPIGRLLYGVACPAGIMWSPAGAHTTFTWNGCDNAALRLVYNDSTYGDNADGYTWIATKTAKAPIIPPPIAAFLSAVLPAPIVSIISSILPDLLPTTTTTTTSTTSTTVAPPPPPPPPVDRYGITSYNRMTGGAPHFGYFDSAYQAFTAKSNRITFLGVTVGTPNYTPDGHTVRIRLCGDSACNQILAEANPQITNYGNSFADIGDVAVNPGQQYYVVYYQPAAWHGQTWVTYWWAGGNSVSTSDQMQAIVKGFNSSQPPPTPPPPPPPTNNYLIQTDGRCANVRTGPDTTYQVVTCLANRTPIAIECQTRGGPAYTNDGQASYVWDRLSSPNGGNYVSDTLVNTPAFNDFSPGIAQCSGGPVVGPPIPPNTHDCESFVADVTVLDGTKVNRGATFTKTWRLLNCGNTDWSDLTAQRIGGNFGPPSFAVPVTAPGSTVDVSVTLTAPNATGLARVTYALTGPRGRVPIKDGTPGYFYAEINVVNSGGTTTPPPTGGARYVALGDSVSAGEGINYGWTWVPNSQGTDGTWQGPAVPNPRWYPSSSVDATLCHRSQSAFPYLFSTAVGTGSLVDVACTGASVGSGVMGPQAVNGGTVAPQLGSLAANPDVITITIGADDLGFSHVLDTCYHEVRCDIDLGLFDYLTKGLQRQKDNLRVLLRTIQSQSMATFHRVPLVLVATYYDPFPAQYHHCADITPALNTIGLSSEEMSFLKSETVELNRNIRTVVGEYASFAKIVPIDKDPSFQAHAFCTREPWFYGASIRIQSGQGENPAPFHPTRAGQAQIARDFEAAYRSR